MADGTARWPPIFVGHELIRFMRPMLHSGVLTMVIDQNPEQQTRCALDVLMHYFGNAEMTHVHPPYESRAPCKTFGPEYLPPL